METAAIVTAILATGYQVSEAEKAKKKAKENEKKMLSQQAEQERQLKEKEMSANRRKSEAFQVAANKNRGMGVSRPTIATSPLGLPGNFGDKKSLLGA